MQKAADLPVLIVRKQRTDKVGPVHKISRPTSVAFFLKMPQLSEVPQAGDQVFKPEPMERVFHMRSASYFVANMRKRLKKSPVLLTASNSKSAGNLITPGYGGDKI